MTTDLAIRPGDALSEEQLIERLSALLACDGSFRLAQRRLQEDGIEIEVAELKRLRDRHPGMYQALAVERSRAQEEVIAQEFRELARLGQRASKVFLDDLLEGMENNTLPNDLRRQMPQLLQAIAKIQQVSVDKLLSITGRPQDGGNSDPLGAARELIELGILVPRERPADTDTTAEEATP